MTTALKGLADGSRTGKREKTVLTPDCILDVCKAVWYMIGLDPATTRDNPVNAYAYCTGEYGMNVNKVDGLALHWSDQYETVFLNPPYADLAAWLAKSRQAFAGGLTEQILLVPARSHRAWWCEYMREAAAIAYLKPLKFRGFDQAFPAPLVLVYTGDSVREFTDACHSVAHHVGGAL